jgi:hypothetical protein
MMASFDIRAAAQDCVDRFHLLIGTETEIHSNNEADDTFHDVIRIEDQFARFKMWAGNIGAFAEDHASLDYRLRDSEETKQFMLVFLRSLSDFITRGELLRSQPALYNPCHSSFHHFDPLSFQRLRN